MASPDTIVRGDMEDEDVAALLGLGAPKEESAPLTGKRERDDGEGEAAEGGAPKKKAASQTDEWQKAGSAMRCLTAAKKAAECLLALRESEKASMAQAWDNGKLIGHAPSLTWEEEAAVFHVVQYLHAKYWTVGRGLPDLASLDGSSRWNMGEEFLGLVEPALQVTDEAPWSTFKDGMDKTDALDACCKLFSGVVEDMNVVRLLLPLHLCLGAKGIRREKNVTIARRVLWQAVEWWTLKDGPDKEMMGAIDGFCEHLHNKLVSLRQNIPPVQGGAPRRAHLLIPPAVVKVLNAVTPEMSEQNKLNALIHHFTLKNNLNNEVGIKSLRWLSMLGDVDLKNDGDGRKTANELNAAQVELYGARYEEKMALDVRKKQEDEYNTILRIMDGDVDDLEVMEIGERLEEATKKCKAAAKKVAEYIQKNDAAWEKHGHLSWARYRDGVRVHHTQKGDRVVCGE